jgi:hypothetical protein
VDRCEIPPDVAAVRLADGAHDGLSPHVDQKTCPCALRVAGEGLFPVAAAVGALEKGAWGVLLERRRDRGGPMATHVFQEAPRAVAVCSLVQLSRGEVVTGFDEGLHEGLPHRASDGTMIKKMAALVLLGKREAERGVCRTLHVSNEEVDQVLDVLVVRQSVFSELPCEATTGTFLELEREPVVVEAGHKRHGGGILGVGLGCGNDGG